ncbi:hypothetical protein [Streptomyces sp. NPDC046862]|uniref:hypothetical protein n=1 Tax=Streptomyces sp. NPDC046862 TaxID=3154603 RepID=UPI003453280A
MERLGGLLRGHIELLVPELAGMEPRMSGAQQRIARRVLTRTRHILKEPIAGSPRGVWDLAIQCRALLTLHEYPGLLRGRPIAGGRS